MDSKPSFNCALITGATSGIGKELANLLGKKKIELILPSRTSPTLPIDLADTESRKKLLKIISDKTPDLIINNAGFGLGGNTLDTPIEDQLQMIELNIKALVEISIHGAQELIRAGKKGTILNISSLAGFVPIPHFNVYSASKSFVKNFSLALDAELHGTGVRVLCACPGLVLTNFAERAGGHKKPNLLTMTAEEVALHIWKQIQKQKRLNIIGWKNKMSLPMLKLFPDFISEKFAEWVVKTQF